MTVATLEQNQWIEHVLGFRFVASAMLCMVILVWPLSDKGELT
jgi:hypothetical protein